MTRIAIVGEAFGENEEREGRPFVGASGHFLRGSLAQVGININECFLTNVFNFRPVGNDIKTLYGLATTAIRGWPDIERGKYIRAEFTAELLRLQRELTAFAPTLVLALGNTASWALLKASAITRIRGSAQSSHWGFKVLPTFHPSAILRQYDLRPIFIKDLAKAAYEASFPEVRRPHRLIHVEPSYEDLLSFEQEFIEPATRLSIDIETAANQITCIGFAPSADRAIVIPFYDPTKADGNYWPSLEEELRVWDWVRKQCGRKISSVGQNFNYDMKFLFASYNIPVPYADHDTMLLSHAMQPELKKSLGFLASIYTGEMPWKFMRPKHETVKKED